MKYEIDVGKMFRKSDEIVIYKSMGKWICYTYTNQYRINAKDRKELVKMCCHDHKVSPSDVKFVKWYKMIGVDK
jgi:hypothetical protein